MKQIALLMFMVVSLSSFAAPSGGTTPPATAAPATARSQVDRLVEKRLEQTLSFPEFASESNLQGAVFVSFEIAENGEITIKDIESTDENLGNYVQAKLEGLNLGAVKLSKAMLFNYRFTFKQES